MYTNNGFEQFEDIDEKKKAFANNLITRILSKCNLKLINIMNKIRLRTYNIHF